MCQQGLQTTSPPTLYSLWECHRSLGNSNNEERATFQGPPSFVARHITYRFLSRFK